MAKKFYWLHLTAEDVEALMTALESQNKDPDASEQIEAVKPKVEALYGIVTATADRQKAYEHYKEVTGYNAICSKSDVS